MKNFALCSYKAQMRASQRMTRKLDPVPNNEQSIWCPTVRK